MSNQQRAVDSLIHDTNNVLSRQSFYENHIEKWLKNLPPEVHSEYNTSIPYAALEYFKTERKKLKDIVDKYYLRFKGDFSDESMGFTTNKQ